VLQLNQIVLSYRCCQ